MFYSLRLVFTIYDLGFGLNPCSYNLIYETSIKKWCRYITQNEAIELNRNAIGVDGIHNDGISIGGILIRMRAFITHPASYLPQKESDTPDIII